MTAEDKTITHFSTRVRQMLLEYKHVCEENSRLKEELKKCNEDLKEIQNQLKLKQENYNSLMTAKMLEANEGDLEAAKARLAKLIRRVNKCITLLAEK